MKFEELRSSRIGTRFGNFTTVQYANAGKNRYIFSCDCGNTRVHNWHRVACGEIHSCGKCNFAKHSMGAEEFIVWVDRVYNHCKSSGLI